MAAIGVMWSQSLFIAVVVGTGGMLKLLLKIGDARPRPALLAHLGRCEFAELSQRLPQSQRNQGFSTMF